MYLTCTITRTWVCCADLEAEQSRLVYSGLVLLSELVVWIGGGDLIVWWSGREDGLMAL